MSDLTALVPMRHSSERVPGKNYRLLGDRPLYHHIVLTLLQTECVTHVVIDTDSEFIREDAAEHFPTVRLLERPAHLRDGETPMNAVIANSLASIDASFVLQTHSTNPFLTPASIERGFASLHGDSAYDSAFSVTQLQARLWDGDARPVNHDPEQLLRTQDLPPLFIENSSFFIFNRDTFLETGNRIGRRPLMVRTSPLESLDIDVEEDFQLAAEIMYGRSFGE